MTDADRVHRPTAAGPGPRQRAAAEVADAAREPLDRVLYVLEPAAPEVLERVPELVRRRYRREPPPPEAA